ncbi:MAG TPA: bifunctional UDP-N-acetylglucosamine diphosphorylase/glucosamine-1-phosphate N-acetyltransferase GlmU [Oscillospiraceae bacterium]|nr:bifunctional UDP-N-acetylglucosamine diphosphorylase/glucosamine-1-phosphate N-acetyltransferase GlmU [Oscillospiraceae bacterium]
MSEACALIYTAGETRIRDDRPDALCDVLFQPMIDWVSAALDEAGITDRCYVFAKNAEAFSAYTGDAPVFSGEEGSYLPYAAKDWVAQHGDRDVLIIRAENPFLGAETVSASWAYHINNGQKLTILASGGREAMIRELNSSAYWVKADFLFELFDHGDPKEEKFLAAALTVLSDREETAATFVAARKELYMTASDPVGLLTLNAAARTIVLTKLCKAGVEFLCTDGILIAPSVQIGKNTTILPGTILKGNTVIGENCEIGPNSYIENCAVGDGCKIFATKMADAIFKNGAKIGPFSQIRPGTVIGEDVKIGDYVEIKNSEVGARTSVAHLTYIGDADVGEGVNFGCGVCIVNFDGQKKYRTVIGDNAFIGCNTNLIAPVKVGSFAYTAAGTTVTEDVPDEALCIGRPRQENKEEWVRLHNKVRKN